MRILILGIDGYIGWSLALDLLSKGHEIYGVDNLSRRRRVDVLDSNSITPIMSWKERVIYLHEISLLTGRLRNFNLGGDQVTLSDFLSECQPEVIFHLAEQPSAAYSMANAETASSTQQSNVIGTLHLLWAIKEAVPSAHLIKLGTMGEYGTPNCNIPEGRIPEVCLGGYAEGEWLYKCPMSGLLFPRTAGSFYHLSKVMDTLNIEFACRTWGLRSTDIMQGVVFGLNEAHSPVELTRFDYDECFGTVINRFCAEAVAGVPLTVYGKGGQTRGYLPLKDSLQCLNLAMLHPPAQGEYRTLNQFASIYSIIQLAELVLNACQELGLEYHVTGLTNPRIESESHYYNPAHKNLFDLGYVPTTNIYGEIVKLIKQLIPYRNRINTDLINPKILWS